MQLNPHNSPMFWQEFRHRCGCYLQWGMRVPDASGMTHLMAQERVFQFFESIAPYPCPMHGSATGVPVSPLRSNECRYMPASTAWYRPCPPERRIYGDRVSDHLRVPKPDPGSDLR